MHSDLSKAKELLVSGNYTCVMCKGTALHVSHHRGVRPLLELLDSGENLQDFSAADKVVGKATAMLYRLLGVRQVYGAVMSEAALQTLKAGNIEAAWGTLVDHIVNRTGNGPCPMEAATADISDPREALEAVKRKLKELRS